MRRSVPKMAILLGSVTQKTPHHTRAMRGANGAFGGFSLFRQAVGSMAALDGAAQILVEALRP